MAYYPFDGNAQDESGHGSHGTVYGASLTTGRFVNPNSAYNFDGIDDYIEANADNLPTAERTVSLWFNANTIDRPVLLGYGGEGCGTSWFMSINHPNFRNTFSMQAHCKVGLIMASYNKQPVGEWYHWVITTASDGTRIYINGRKVAANNKFVADTAVQGRKIALGVAVSPDGKAPFTDPTIKYFDGILDDVVIWNRALSEAEVLELYNTKILPIK